mmetsp:Transcript_29239/g.41080  ORF Transcript_29239/g.41080 Transcript_29239/m.41080 type:complete len:181 (-) Transcript_29239:67-609(-)
MRLQVFLDVILLLIILILIIFIIITTSWLFCIRFCLGLINDGLHLLHELLLLLIVIFLFSTWVLIQPFNDILDSLINSCLLVIVHLGSELFIIVDLVSQAVGITLKAISCLNLLSDLTILLFKLLSFSDHTINFLLSQTSTVIGDSDLIGLSSLLIFSRDLQDTVLINVEGHLNLGDTTR